MSSKRPGRGFRRLIVTLVVLAALTACTQPDGRLHLVALDVGQGDAILVRGPDGATALIDGGPDPDLAVRRLGEGLPFWQRDIDLLGLTHPHEDHVAGLVPVLERFRVGAVLDAVRVVHGEHGRVAEHQRPPRRQCGVRRVRAWCGCHGWPPIWSCGQLSEETTDTCPYHGYE